MTEASTSQQGDGGGGRGSGGRGGGRGNKSRGGRGRGGRGKKNNKNEKKEVNSKDTGSKDQSNNNKSSVSIKGGDASKNVPKSINKGAEANKNNNRNRRRNNQNKNNKRGGDKKQKDPVFSKISKEEEERLEKERLKKIEEEAEQKRLEEEERAQQALREIRHKAEKELHDKYKEALDHLKSVVETTEARKANRDAMSTEYLVTSRKEFEANKKSLKSDLKKCTAFVKKIKTGGAWSMTTDALIKDVSSLNLSRYVEEVVAAVLEAKVKLTDLPVLLILCKNMNLRYPSFLPALMAGMWSVVHSKPADVESSKLRRVYVRLLTELLLNGLATETKPLMKLIAEVSGGKDGSYNVIDASLVVAFIKAAGFEILGTRPTSIQKYSKVIAEEILKKDIEEEKFSDGEKLNSIVLISEKEAAEGRDLLADVNQLLMERAISSEISNKFLGHCKGAYGFLSKSLINTDTKLQKMEKRCEQDRLLAGSLTEAREKGLQDARKLRDSLEKSVEAMSDILDLPLPKLEEEAEEEIEGGTGVEVWTKDGADEIDTDFGPFDDEETRAFYCDVPDFLTTVPPALLGLKPEEIEKRKALNQAKFGSSFGDDNDTDAETLTTEVAASSEAELEAAEQEEDKDSGGDNEESKDENKDTPHYKLMVLLEQELPECSRREQIDEISEKFCTNHGSSKNARKRLSQTLFHVPRARLDLLPYYSRMTATLGRVWPDIGDALLIDLEQQFHGQAKFKKNQNIESRMRTARYVGELTIFRMAPPIVALRCLRRCLDDFTGGNVDVACCLLESCGKYLYRLPHTNKKLNNIMETMLRLSKAKRLEERAIALIKTAMYTVKPPASATKKEVKEYPPLEGYLRHILMVTLQPTESSISFVSKQLLRFPWADSSIGCGALICKIMLKACRVGRYRSIHAVANVAAKLRRQKPEVCIRLLDLVVEELQWSIEHPAFKDQQRTLTVARLLGELYVASLASGQLIVQQLYQFINFGHEIPESLREASEKAVALSGSNEESLSILNSASGVSQTIHEDQEMDQDEMDVKQEEEKEEVQPVAVSAHSKCDPRVFSVLDPPNSVFRIKLVCVLLEVVSKTLVTRNNITKIDAFLASFQRYLFTKTTLPTEVEFALLDTFDAIDSQWREVLKDQKKKNPDDAERLQGFRRYRTWFEAHNVTIANEESEAAIESRAHVRLEALAGNNAVSVEVGASDLLNDEDELEEEDYDSDAMSVDTKDSDDDSISVEEGNNEEGSHDPEESSLEGDEFDEDTEESDDEESEEEFDEEAYMRQLEEEAFEAELRRLTMDALEKGKSTSRGGKVSDNMVSGSQFIKKKQPDAAMSTMPNVALGGMEGISFNLLKKGNKGKMEAKQFFVPKDTNLAAVATKQDDEAARERDMIKARVLQYEAESAVSEGNVYLEQEKLQVIRNRPLSMEEIDKNFGTTGGNLVNAPSKKPPHAGGNQTGGRVGRGYSFGRMGNSFGRGGRGRGRTSGRGLV